MTHLLLTGEVQVGKSTLIRRLLEAHPGWRVGGFQTVTRWAGRQGSVHMIPACAGQEACTADNCVGLRNLDVKRPVSYPEVFDRVGPGLLRPEGADLLLMDELGTMERQSPAFCGASSQSRRTGTGLSWDESAPGISPASTASAFFSDSSSASSAGMRARVSSTT